MDTPDNQPPIEVIQAWQQLVMLNLESYKPQVTDWLHSEDAKPVLKQLLVNVPCAGRIH
jgi:hypothetical protein